MPGRFDGAVVAITGAGSGIGRASGRRFAALGATVALADIDADALAAVAGDLSGAAVRPQTARVDVGDRQAVHDWAARLRAEHGRVDVVVNNAGVGLVGTVAETAHADWEWVVRTNYWGIVHGIEAFLPAMQERRSGHIVNVASANGLFAFPYGGVYASTKFAIVGLSEALRAEAAVYGVGVSVVCPGLTRTAILGKARVGMGGARAQRFFRRFVATFDARGVDPDVVARALAGAVARNAAVVRVPGHVAALDLLHRFAPGVYRRAIARLVARHAGGDAAGGRNDA